MRLPQIIPSCLLSGSIFQIQGSFGKRECTGLKNIISIRSFQPFSQNILYSFGNKKTRSELRAKYEPYFLKYCKIIFILFFVK